MSYEKAPVDLKEAAQKVVVGGGLFLAGAYADKSQLSCETLGATLALSAGLFGAESRKKPVNIFNRSGNER